MHVDNAFLNQINTRTSLVSLKLPLDSFPMVLPSSFPSFLNDTDFKESCLHERALEMLFPGEWATAASTPLKKSDSLPQQPFTAKGSSAGGGASGAPPSSLLGC